ncbi:MAG: tetratricopeptide repeat protein [bacterium]
MDWCEEREEFEIFGAHPLLFCLILRHSRAGIRFGHEENEAQKNLQMAKVLLKKGFGSKAIPRLKKALELDPSLTEARMLIGELYIKEGNNEEARAHFEEVLKVDSDSNNARVGLACVLIAQGDLAGAEAELKKAMALNPNPAKAMCHLGQVYKKKGEVQKAMHTYRDAIESLLK